jgi:hypothetical protein
VHLSLSLSLLAERAGFRVRRWFAAVGRAPGAVLCCLVLALAGLCLPGAAVAGEGCPNEQLRGESSSLGLPDCRAYEMVTPVDKGGAFVSAVGTGVGSTEVMVDPVGGVAPDGSSVAGETAEAFAGVENDEVQAETVGQVYRFSRTPSGWVTTPLNPTRGFLWSLGLGESLWGPAEQAYPLGRLRLREADGAVREVGPAWPPALGSSLEREFSVGGTAAEPSNGVVFFTKPGFHWPFDSTLAGLSSLYEYKGTSNVAPSLVAVSGGAGSTALISQCGEQFGAISEDGSRVFFTVTGADNNNCGGSEPSVNEVFARVDESQTVAISEPSVADCPGCDTSAPQDAAFQAASGNGSVVLFTTTQPLLGSDTSENLYEYDFAPPAGEPRVVQVSGGDGSGSGPAEVKRVVNVSQDGSHVYFIAHGVLTTVPNGQNEVAQAGAENLYVFERDAQYPAGRTAFVAGCADIGRTTGGEPQVVGAAEPEPKSTQSTPDGRVLVFASKCHLTADDTSSARQMFSYDAQTGSMVRVSAGVEGFNDDGNVTGEDPEGDLDAQLAKGRTVSPDGSFVFFESPAGLTPQALNEAQVAATEGAPVYAENVYEYHDGRVWLLGSDSSPAGTQVVPVGLGVVLIGASESGGDVFFRTGDQLVPQDTDTQADFYDARVDGGFPAPVAPLGCEGDGCQGVVLAAPVFGSPASVVFSGGGNVAPPAPTPTVAPKRKGLTAAQKLARALKACARQPRSRRASCRVRARRLYGHSARVTSDRRGK